MKRREPMDQHEKAYRKLQRHLNRQAVGFPATRSGIEIKLLKHIFSPKDAEIATCLDYRPEPLDTIFESLVLQVSNTKKAFHICSCCGCYSKKLFVDAVRTGRTDLLK